MAWVRAAILAGACALALTGCSKGADKDGDGKISADEAKAEASKGGEVKLQPGQWEITFAANEFDMSGMDARMKEMMKAQVSRSTTVKQCLTAEQVEKPGADFFGGAQEANCKYDKFERSGSKVSVAMTCAAPGGGTTRSLADGQFSSDSYRMTTQVSTTGTAGGDMTMKGEITGKRVGDCAA